MLRIGDRIGSYTLLQKIGRGAFGEVWLAEEKTAISTHRVALKLPNEENVDLEAIRQEANVWEEVKGHPNILPIIKADIVEDQINIASEYAPDGSLSKWLKFQGGKAPTVEIAVKMIHGILSGLAHLHSKGIVHRDLKPENILLQAETPRIADFGIARLIKSTSNSTKATGSPSYMAPECFYGTRSEQTDLWAVGVIFHLLLSGKLPFPQPDQVSVMNAVLNGAPDIESSIPINLQSVIAGALRKRPEDRYATASEMLEHISPHSMRFSSITIFTDPEPDAEVSTVVIPKHVERQTVSDRLKLLNVWKIVALALGMLIIVCGGIWASFLLRSNEKANPQKSLTENNNSNLEEVAQPLVPTLTPIPNIEIPHTQISTPKGEIPSGSLPEDGYNAWENNSPPPVSYPESGYVPPSGQYYDGSSSSSQFMDHLDGAELRCKDVQTGQEVPCPTAPSVNKPLLKPSPSPKTSAANANVQTPPIPTASPKPGPTPVKTDKPAGNVPQPKDKPAAKPTGKPGEPE